MKIIISTMLFAATVLTGSMVIAATGRVYAPTFRSLFGDWKLVKVIGFGDPTGSEKDGRVGVGTIVTISSVQISDTHEPSAICGPRNPVVKYVLAESVLEKEFGTTASNIKLPRGAMKRKMPYMDAGCASAFVLNRQELIWPLGNGFYYLAIRQARPGS